MSHDYYLSLGPTFVYSSRNLYCISSTHGSLPLYFLKSNILLIIHCNFIQMNCLLRIALSLKGYEPGTALLLI